jgi:hypothetical protein
VDPCSPNPCQNNGICTATGTSFVCACLDGFSGQRCETRKYLKELELLILSNNNYFHNIYYINDIR